MKSILDFNETLYKDIRKALGTNPSESNKLAETFMILVQFLKMYSIYCQNRPNSISAQERCRKKSPKLDKFVEEAQNQLPGAQTMDSFLVKPVQRYVASAAVRLLGDLFDRLVPRICRYPLLFSGILKNTPKTHPDFDTIEKTLTKLQEVAASVNEFSKKKDNDDKLFELGLKLVEFPDGSINAPGRLVVLERVDMDAITPSTGDKRETHQVFLFSDMLLFAKSKKKKLLFKHKMPLATATWRDLEPAEDDDKWPLEITDGSVEGSPAVYVIYDITKIERTNFTRKLDEYSKEQKAKAAAAPAAAPTSPSKSALLRVAPKKKTRSISVSGPKDTSSESKKDSTDSAAAPADAAATEKKSRRLSTGLIRSPSSGSDDLGNGKEPTITVVNASPPKRSGSSSALAPLQEEEPGSPTSTAPATTTTIAVGQVDAPPRESSRKDASPLKARFPGGGSTEDKRSRMKRASSQGNFGVRDKVNSSSGKASLNLAEIPKLSSKARESSKDKESSRDKESSKDSSSRESAKESKESNKDGETSAHRRESSRGDSSAHRRLSSGTKESTTTAASLDDSESSSKEKKSRREPKEDDKEKDKEKDKESQKEKDRKRHHTREKSTNSPRSSEDADSSSEADLKKLKTENQQLKAQLDESKQKNATLAEYVAEVEKTLAKIKALLSDPSK